MTSKLTLRLSTDHFKDSTLQKHLTCPLLKWTHPLKKLESLSLITACINRLYQCKVSNWALKHFSEALKIWNVKFSSCYRNFLVMWSHDDKSNHSLQLWRATAKKNVVSASSYQLTLLDLTKKYYAIYYFVGGGKKRIDDIKWFITSSWTFVVRKQNTNCSNCVTMTNMDTIISRK